MVSVSLYQMHVFVTSWAVGANSVKFIANMTRVVSEFKLETRLLRSRNFQENNNTLKHTHRNEEVSKCMVT